MGLRLPSGLLLWWIIAAAACVLIGAAAAVRPTATKSPAFYMRRIDAATPRTAVSPTFSLKEVSYPSTLGSGVEYRWEHADARSDRQHSRIPAIFKRVGGWRFCNSRRLANKRRKMAGAVELGGLAEIDMGVRMWGLNGVSKIISTATAQGHRFPVTGIG